MVGSDGREGSGAAGDEANGAGCLNNNFTVYLLACLFYYLFIYLFIH
jgi:hypothetical protein